MKITEQGSFPCNYAIVDEFLTKEQLEHIDQEWPSHDWEGWVKYDARYEDKRASNLTTPLPPACGWALAKMASSGLDVLVDLPTAVPDLGLHGAGLHECPPGGKLDCHLDAEIHPRLNIRRVYSAILYVHRDWKATYHGEFVLCDDEKRVIKKIEPLPGRLVVFDCRTTYHGVLPVWHAGNARRSLALFGYMKYDALNVHEARKRAVFEPWPGEEHLKEAMRER